MGSTEKLISEVDRWSAHNYHPLPVVLENGEGVLGLGRRG